MPHTPNASGSIDHPIDTDRKRLTAERESHKPWWFVAAAFFLGLAFLAKYNALILIPIFVTLILSSVVANFADRKSLRRLRNGALIAAVGFLAVASPVIIYNIQLYRTFGHFDFQFSLLFGQVVEAWQSRPGQEVLGSYADRIRDFIPRLIEANSPYFLILAAVGVGFMLVEWLRSHRRSREGIRDQLRVTGYQLPVTGNWFLVTVIFWLLPFLVFIGPARRFLTLLTPWLALAAGYGLTAIAQFRHSHILKNMRMSSATVSIAALTLIVAGEALYAYNSVVALAPAGAAPWAYSRLRRESHAWGFNELEAHLANTLNGKMPAVGITFEFPFSRRLLNEAAARGQAEGRETAAWGIIYNDNINLSAQLWVFLRRITYEGWPVASAENFRRGGGAQFFRDAGVKRIIFVNTTDSALQDRPREPSPDGDLMEAELRRAGIIPTEIKTPRGEVAFRVYAFDL